MAASVTAYTIALLYAGCRHGNLRTRIVPHDRALLPQTNVFVADAIDCRVSARLAARRRRVGIDRALLDLLLDARDGTVERLETGRSRIAPSRLLQLARILDVPIDWFFDEAQSEAPPAEPVFSRGGERQAEARRFLALYARIADPKVRAEIREMVRSLAVASSRPISSPRGQDALHTFSSSDTHAHAPRSGY